MSEDKIVIEKREYFRCNNCANGEEFRLDHLDKSEDSIEGPWFCDNCGSGYKIEIKDGTFDIRPYEGDRKYKPVLVLFKLDLGTEPMYFVKKAMHIAPIEFDYVRFYYEEFKNIEDWLDLELVMHEGDMDPCDKIKVVKVVEDFDLDISRDKYDILELFPEIATEEQLEIIEDYKNDYEKAVAPKAKITVESFSLSDAEKEYNESIVKRFTELKLTSPDELSMRFGDVSHRILYADDPLFGAFMYSCSLHRDNRESGFFTLIRNILYKIFAHSHTDGRSEVFNSSRHLVSTIIKALDADRDNAIEAFRKHSYLLLTALAGISEKSIEILRGPLPPAVVMGVPSRFVTSEEKAKLYNSMKALAENPNSSYSELNELFSDLVEEFVSSEVIRSIYS